MVSSEVLSWVYAFGHGAARVVWKVLGTGVARPANDPLTLPDIGGWTLERQEETAALAGSAVSR